MIIKTVHQRVDDAVLDLMFNHPFYASMYMMLDVYPDDRCQTAWTDGVSIGWSPTFFETLTKPEILGVTVHEILHVVFKHHLRILTEPVYKLMPHKFNRAADFAINPEIYRTPGMDLPAGCLIDMDNWADTTLEVIFSHLPDKGPAGVGEVRPFPGPECNNSPSPAEIAEAEAAVDSMVKAAAQKARGAGKMGGGLDRMVDKAVDSQEPWESHLQHLVEMICRNDYSWSQPNPRYIQSGVYLPVLRSEAMPDLVFVVDTSGSVGRAELNQIMAEIARILETFNCRVIVLYVDTKYRGHEEFDGTEVRAGNFKLKPKGGGGTRFKPAFDWVESQDEIDPAAIIYFTDLDNSASEWATMQEPDCPVMWGHLPRHGGFNKRLADRVTFGDIVQVNMVTNR